MENFENGVGRHFLIELYDCETSKLDDEKFVENTLLKACEMSKATIINSIFHKFSPQGVSGVVVIAESHFSIHTWPENSYAALDFFTCSAQLDVKNAIEYVEEVFGSEYAEVKEVVRGEAVKVEN